MSIRSDEGPDQKILDQIYENAKKKIMDEAKAFEDKIDSNAFIGEDAENKIRALEERAKRLTQEASNQAKDVQVQQSTGTQLEEVLSKRSAAELLGYLKRSKVEANFYPHVRQKPSVLLSLLQQILVIAPNEAKLFGPWVESALLDLNINDPMIRCFAPELFRDLERCKPILQQTSVHIMRSLSQELKN